MKRLLLSSSSGKKWLLLTGVSVLLSLFWISVFYPGLPNSDALYQWKQARENFYTDVHPIGVTLIMRGIIVLFPYLLAQEQMAILCFLQAVILWLTVFYTIDIFIANSKIKLIANIFVPLYYPLWTFSISPIKDVWSTILFLLLVTTIYQLFDQRFSSQNFNSKRAFLKKYLSLVIILLLSYWLMLTRHNIFLSLLLLMIYLYSISYYFLNVSLQQRKKQYLIIFLMIVALFFSKATGDFYYKNSHLTPGERQEFASSLVAFNQQLSTQEKMNFYFSLELIGTLHYTEKNLNSLEYLKTPDQLGREKIAQAVNNYRCGLNDQYLYLGKKAPLRNMQGDAMKASIVEDLWKLTINYPQAFLKYKICAMASLLQVNQILFPFQTDIPVNSLSNDLGIKSKNYLPTIRGRVIKFLNLVSYDQRFFIFNLPYRHYLLLIISLITTLYTTIKHKPKSWKNATYLFLFGAGLCNFIPYMIVTPDYAWRYLLFSNIVWLLSILSIGNPLVELKPKN
ncbi:hypothetical protein cce_2914 [Crocosphaera subtropica ATCC 51142]|uniref:Glycosyltransferase RgtA/B/C/D-like domain-containing protein n=1 Tax=Crocosphaera subtropica (strain ATCC 51142 / BH68) TaxID=43989 RepID=B1WV65_CROS5|nr:hypothetical protein [Crocosphaera subtropica]ACB52262.1 hypothetical protein cce_2914 [Crocosphaera subtropica ATCC 51142]